MDEQKDSQMIEFEDDSASEVEMADELTSAIDDDWYSDVPNKEEPEEAEEETTEEAEEETDADQQEVESEESDKAESEKTEAEPVEDDGSYLELKHFDEVRKVNKDEAKVLAQKGMDYDRIHADREALKNENAELRQYKMDAEKNAEIIAFVHKLAERTGQTVEEVMDGTTARLLAQDAKKNGEDRTEAQILEQLRTDRALKVQQAQQQSQQQARDNMKQEFDAFAEKYKDAKVENMPQTIWNDYRSGKGSLESLYLKHLAEIERAEKDAEIAKLKAENETLRQNNKNAERATGSRKSNGGHSKSKSDFDALWYDGT